MRTLINVVPVLAAVLFGSVPVSAQSAQEGGVSWDVIGTGITILVALGGVLWRLDRKIEGVRSDLKQDSEKAHSRIEGNIVASENRVKNDVNRIYAHINEVTDSVKNDVNRIYAHIDESEKRVTASVQDDVSRLYARIDESEKKVTTSVQNDVDRIYGQINTLIGTVGKKD